MSAKKSAMSTTVTSTNGAARRNARGQRTQVFSGSGFFPSAGPGCRPRLTNSEAWCFRVRCFIATVATRHGQNAHYQGPDPYHHVMTLDSQSDPKVGSPW